MSNVPAGRIEITRAFRLITFLTLICSGLFFHAATIAATVDDDLAPLAIPIPPHPGSSGTSDPSQLAGEQGIVPAVSGLTPAEAVKKLSRAGFVPVVASEAVDSSQAKGFVAYTDPVGGSRGITGTTVTIYVSTGTPPPPDPEPTKTTKPTKPQPTPSPTSSDGGNPGQGGGNAGQGGGNPGQGGGNPGGGG